MLERGQHFRTHRVLRDVELDAAGAVLQRREAGLAHHALEHHPAGDDGLHAQRFQFLVRHLAVLVVQVGRAVLGLEIVREGDAGGAQGLQLLAPLGHQLVVVGHRALLWVNSLNLLQF